MSSVILNGAMIQQLADRFNRDDENVFPINRGKVGYARQIGTGSISIASADTPVALAIPTTLPVFSDQWTQENNAELLYMTNNTRIIFIFMDIIVQKMIGADRTYQFDLLLNGVIKDTNIVPVNDAKPLRQAFTSPLIVTTTPNLNTITSQVTCIGNDTDLELLDYKLTAVDLLAAA